MIEEWEPPSPPSFDACGMGKGPRCCKFVVVGGDGIECARYTPLGDFLALRKMGAEFVPMQVDCQAERVTLGDA
jgi:hypothetical protein